MFDQQKKSPSLTGLFYFAKHGHEAVVIQLLAEGANPNQANILGGTALHAASVNGYEAIVAALLKAGADANKADNSGKTPLHMAAANKHWQILILLVGYAHNQQIDLRYIFKKLKKQLPNEILRENIRPFFPTYHDARVNIQAIIETTPDMPEDVQATLNWIASKPGDPLLHHQTLGRSEELLAKMRPGKPESPIGQILLPLLHACAKNLANLMQRAYRTPPVYSLSMKHNIRLIVSMN